MSGTDWANSLSVAMNENLGLKESFRAILGQSIRSAQNPAGVSGGRAVRNRSSCRVRSWTRVFSMAAGGESVTGLLAAGVWSAPADRSVPRVGPGPP